MLYKKGLLLLCLSLLSGSTQALTFKITPSTDVVGHIYEVSAHLGETLLDVGRRNDIGAFQIIAANPNLSPKKALNVGIPVVIPAQFILPNVPREGIVINLAEQRMYYYLEDNETLITEPVGIGRQGEWQTPLGETKIIKKVIEPNWYPTANVRREAAKHGTPIPWKFPPGPNNPIGKHILRLGWNSYLIHGTNQTESVGGQVSAGCIRMLPEGIERLFDKVAPGTKVKVIDEPYKIGLKNHQIFLESHNSVNNKTISMKDVITQIQQKISLEKSLIRWQQVQKYGLERSGLPKIIGHTL